MQWCVVDGTSITATNVKVYVYFYICELSITDIVMKQVLLLLTIHDVDKYIYYNHKHIMSIHGIVSVRRMLYS